MVDRKRIIINFKNTVEEIELYEFLKTKSCISGYIKDVLKEHLSESNKSRVRNIPNEESNSNGILDILNI